MLIGQKDIPYISLVLPDKTEAKIPLIGPVAARFFKRARGAMGYGSRPITEFAEVLEKGGPFELDFEQICDAVKGLIPQVVREKISDKATGELLFTMAEYQGIFQEAWGKVNESFFIEENPGEKK